MAVEKDISGYLGFVCSIIFIITVFSLSDITFLGVNITFCEGTSPCQSPKENFTYDIEPQSIDDITLIFNLRGDLNNVGEYVELYAEGDFLGRYAEDSGIRCTSYGDSNFTADVTAYGSDGIIIYWFNSSDAVSCATGPEYIAEIWLKINYTACNSSRYNQTRESLYDTYHYICDRVSDRDTWNPCNDTGKITYNYRGYCAVSGNFWEICFSEGLTSDNMYFCNATQLWEPCNNQTLEGNTSSYYCKGYGQWEECSTTKTLTSDSIYYCPGLAPFTWEACDVAETYRDGLYTAEYYCAGEGVWETCDEKKVSTDSRAFCDGISGSWEGCGIEEKLSSTDNYGYCPGDNGGWTICDTLKRINGSLGQYYCAGNSGAWQTCGSAKTITTDNYYYCAGDSGAWQRCDTPMAIRDSDTVLNYYYCAATGGNYLWQPCDMWKISQGDSGRAYCPGQDRSWQICDSLGLSTDEMAYCSGPGGLWTLCDITHNMVTKDSETTEDYYYCNGVNNIWEGCPLGGGVSGDSHAYCRGSGYGWEVCGRLYLGLTSDYRGYCPYSSSTLELCDIAATTSKDGRSYCSDALTWVLCNKTKLSPDEKAFCPENGAVWEICQGSGTVSQSDGRYYCDSSTGKWEKCSVSKSLSSDGEAYCPVAGANWELCDKEKLSSDKYGFCPGITYTWELCDAVDKTAGVYKCYSALVWKKVDGVSCISHAECYSGICDFEDGYGDTDPAVCISCTGKLDNSGNCEQKCGADAPCDERIGCVTGIGYCNTTTCEYIAGVDTDGECYGCNSACLSGYCSAESKCAVAAGGRCTASSQCETNYYCSIDRVCVDTGIVGDSCLFDQDDTIPTGSICEIGDNIYTCCHQICIDLAFDYDQCVAEQDCGTYPGETCYHPTGDIGTCCGNYCYRTTDLRGIGESCNLDCQCANPEFVICADGRCKYRADCNTGDCPCTKSEDCESGLCDDTTGHCVPVGTTGGRCRIDVAAGTYGVFCNETTGWHCCGQTCVDTDGSDLCGVESAQCADMLGIACYEGDTGAEGICCGAGTSWSCITPTERVGFGEACLVDCHCADNLRCKEGSCKKVSGQSCSEKSDCYTELCDYATSLCVDTGTVGELCRVTTLTTGVYCSTVSGLICCDNVCIDEATDICGAETNCDGKSEITVCYEANGEQGYCCGDKCITASEKKSVLSPCTLDCECGADMMCVDGYCRYIAGHSCQKSDECISRLCSKNTTICIAQTEGEFGAPCWADVDVAGVMCKTSEVFQCCAGVCIRPDVGYDVCGIESTCDTAEYQLRTCYEGPTGLRGECCAADCQTGAKKTAGQNCTYTCECDTGLECRQGECKAVLGQDCASADECSTPACVEKSGVFKCDSCYSETQGFACLSGDGTQVGTCCGSECLFTKKPLDEPCSADCECQSGKCSYNKGNLCKYADGVSCTSADECDNTDCVNGKCGSCSYIGSEGLPCSSSGPAHCCNGICLLDADKKGVGLSCEADCECQDNTECVNGTCRLVNGEPCSGGGDCKSDVCVDGYCSSCEAAADRTLCKTSTVLSGQCCNGLCVAKKGLGVSCSDDCECDTGMVCSGGVCKLKAGMPCSRATDCATGYCVYKEDVSSYVCSYCNINPGKGCKDDAGDLKTCCAGVCGSEERGEGSACTETCQCGENLLCFNGYCRYVDGQVCATGQQCVSTFCVDKSGTGGYLCGTCDINDITYNHVVLGLSDITPAAVCCSAGYCDKDCVDTDGDGAVDACASCLGVEDGNRCQNVDGIGKCCNDLCIVTKKANGEPCGKDCECAGGYCDPETNTCSNLAGTGDPCTKDEDCASGLACVDTDDDGYIDSCYACSAQEGKKCQDMIGNTLIDGYCCADECREMLDIDWTPGSSCGVPPCDATVTCTQDGWVCGSVGQFKCFEGRSSTCTQKGIFNEGSAISCEPYICEETTGKCKSTCAEGQDCVSGYSCIDVEPVDGIPETCAKCSDSAEYAGRNCVADVVGFCCSSECQALPVEGWTPGGSCGEGGEEGCEGIVSCMSVEETGNYRWMCSSIGRLVCTKEAGKEATAKCSEIGSIDVISSCAPYKCDSETGRCKTRCDGGDDCETGFPCIDVDNDGVKDTCASCYAYEGQICQIENRDGYCCGSACAPMPVPDWVPDGECGTEGTRCGGGVVECVDERWHCSTEGKLICSQDLLKQSVCSNIGVYDESSQISCGYFSCDRYHGECYTKCQSDTQCSSGCCLPSKFQCVQAGTKVLGDPCEKDCECSTEYTCDPGSKTCSKAITCPDGNYINCPADKSLCVDDPFKGWLCKATCYPDHSKCTAKGVTGYCCAGKCIQPPAGYTPDVSCGDGDCSGTMICDLEIGEFACSSKGSGCCDGLNIGYCDNLGVCGEFEETCRSFCKDNVFYEVSCENGMCSNTPIDCNEVGGICNPESGCSECITDADCVDLCEGYIYQNYTCVNNKCILSGIVDCSAGGENKICDIASESGCSSCDSTESCQSQYGANFACDEEKHVCKIAQCFKDENCGFSCENKVFRGKICKNYVCVEQEPVDCRANSLICSSSGCIKCESDYNCTLNYGDEYACKDGQCLKLCGNGICEGSENCASCPQDCKCKESETCDTSLDYEMGCAPDRDGDSFADDLDPCPQDKENRCKLCKTDEDCFNLCIRNKFYDFICQGGKCTPPESIVDCSPEAEICDSRKGCITCDTKADPDKACKKLFGELFICSEFQCLIDRDLDGIPDVDDPCPTDKDNACATRCGNNICEATEDCSTCAKDCACDDGNPCTQDECISGQCIYSKSSCGLPCPEGVCDGTGRCVSISREGEPCLCEAMCEKGTTCSLETKTCAKTVCGDGKCENECGICPQDCKLSDCNNNGICDLLLGENCITARSDCVCRQGYACDITGEVDPEKLDEIGCYKIECGDGICNRPDESSATCCIDCGCPGEGTCDPETNTCVGGCGDGICQKEIECRTAGACSTDCEIEDCIDNICVPAVGENCVNTPDCICKGVIKLNRKELTFVEKEGERLTFIIENAGNIKEKFDVIVEVDPAVETNWKKRENILLEEKATQELSLDVRSKKPGFYDLKIMIYPVSKKNETFSVDVKVTVKKEAITEKITILANIKDLLEIILLTVTILIAVKKRVTRIVSGEVEDEEYEEEEEADTEKDMAVTRAHPYYQQITRYYAPRNGGWRQYGYPSQQLTPAQIEMMKRWAKESVKKEVIKELEEEEELAKYDKGLHIGSRKQGVFEEEGAVKDRKSKKDTPKKKNEDEDEYYNRGFHP